MCGIFGCISEDATKFVLEGLSKLEYRGYDSAGLSAISPRSYGPVETERTTGFVSDLASKVDQRFEGCSISIGHTRWATHGRVTDHNAHPHSSNDGKTSIVHNGIIENASELLERVKNLGYEITSETDSEVIVHLLDNEIKTQPKNKSHLDAFNSVIGQLSGSWAIAAIISGFDGILVARHGSPLVIGKGDSGVCISSDIQPLYGVCSEVAFLGEGDVMSITSSGLEYRGPSDSPVFGTLEGEYTEQDSGTFEHLMLKEIHDQRISISNSIGGRISADGLNAELGGLSLSKHELSSLKRINLVGCGSAYFACLIGAHIIRMHSRATIEVFRSSEFPASIVCNDETLTIGVSQSGETKDTLDALHLAKEYGSHISSFCNVIGSTMSRLTNNGAYLHAGPEYSVASTKAFTSMIAVFSLFGLTIPGMDEKNRRSLISELRKIPNKVTSQILFEDDSIDAAAKLISSSNYVMFIGRGISCPLSMEGALKMMEIAYIPSLAFPAGELKHGPIALIEEGTPVVAICPDDETMIKMESTIRECQSRGAKIILISDSDENISELSDLIIPTKKTHSLLSPIINSIPLQLLAYRAGILRGTNIDKPRNLAKSVTVS